MRERKAAVATLGCKINSFESELIAQSLRRHDWQIVNPEDTADLYVINSCTVTAEADRQTRQTVRKLIRKNPCAKVVVTGCYAQMDSAACLAIPGVDIVLGNDRKLELVEYLDDIDKATPTARVGNLSEHVSLPRELLGGYDSKTRAYVQVQQGCDQGCTFCIIHRARGPSRSIPIANVKDQVEQLLDNGYLEIVVCGVDLGSYGSDLGESGNDLVKLLDSLCAIDREFRIRMSSLDPAHISDELIDLMAREKKLCPHLHLSLQSGNTLILKRMKRRYASDHVYERVARLRSELGGLVLSADIMVGFPTETREQFLDTLQMIETLEVAFPHVFPYSNRNGTPASRIPASRQVDPAEKKQRAHTLRRAGRTVLTDLLESRIQTDIRVLPESQGQGSKPWQFARGDDYLPVRVYTEQEIEDRFMTVTVESSKDGCLIARPAP